MKINLSPVFTSQNFGINFLEVDEKIFNVNCKEFRNTKYINEKNIKIENCKKTQNFNAISNKIDTLTPNFCKKVTIEKTNDSPFEIDFVLNKNENVLCNSLNFVVKQNVSTSIILKFFGNTDGFLSSNINIELEKNSKLDLTIFSNTNCKTFLNINDNKKENAEIFYHLIDFCDNMLIHNLRSNDAGQKTKTTLDTMYVANKNAIVDLNYISTINSPQSKTSFNTIGAISDEVKKSYKATIDFKKGSKTSVGTEKEFCLMLSKNAKSKSLPMILCNEEDVSGSHATSAGKVDEKSLFYIMSRGLSKTEATKLLILAQFEKGIQLLKDEKLKNEIIKELEGKLDAKK